MPEQPLAHPRRTRYGTRSVAALAVSLATCLGLSLASTIPPAAAAHPGPAATASEPVAPGTPSPSLAPATGSQATASGAPAQSPAPGLTSPSMAPPTATEISAPATIVLPDGSVIDRTSIIALPKDSTTPDDVRSLFDAQVKPATAGHTAALAANPGPGDLSRLVRLAVDPAVADAVLESVNSSGLFKAAQFGGSQRSAAYTSTPDDPSFADDGSYALKDGPGGSRFDQAWGSLADMAGPDSAPIAVIDNGFDLTQPDFTGSNVRAGWNMIDDNETVYPCVSRNGTHDGHGTATAGLVGAASDNGYAIPGAAFDGEVLVYQVGILAGVDPAHPEYDSECNDDWGATADAIHRAVAAGVKVISYSVSGDSAPPVLHAAIQDALAAGVLFVAAAGNSAGATPRYPAAFDEVISVAATDSAGDYASFSNLGATVAAGGEGVPTLNLGAGWGHWNGTSFSAPYVASAISLMYRSCPSASTDQIRSALEGTTKGATQIIDVKAAIDQLAAEPNCAQAQATPSPTATATEAPPAPTLSVDLPEMDFPADGGRLSATVTTNQKIWSASSDQTWATVTPTAGLPGQQVTVTAQPNTTGQARNGIVVVTAGDATPAVIRLVQPAQTGAATIGASITVMTLPPAGGTATATITTNQPNWAAAANDTWLTTTPAGAPGDTLSATAGPNTTGSQRAATITLTAGGAQTSVHVVQDPQTPAPTLTASASLLNLPAAGGTGLAVITTNQPGWTAASDQPWVATNLAGVTGQALTVTAPANTTGNPRQALITLAAGSAQAIVRVTQDSLDVTATVSVNVPAVNLPAAGGLQTAVVTTNQPSWAAVPSRDWVTATPAGVTGSVITIQVAANPAPMPRNATVTITAGAAYTIIAISQDAATPSGPGGLPAQLTISQATWNPGKSAQTAKLVLFANQPWQVVESPLWASLKVTGKTVGGGTQVKVHVARNTGPTRTGLIRLETTGPGPRASATLMITQQGRTGLLGWLF